MNKLQEIKFIEIYKNILFQNERIAFFKTIVSPVKIAKIVVETYDPVNRYIDIFEHLTPNEQEALQREISTFILFGSEQAKLELEILTPLNIAIELESVNNQTNNKESK